jgi:hypothetical protein
MCRNPPWVTSSRDASSPAGTVAREPLHLIRRMNENRLT